jgi:hypothetical protein
MNQDPYYLETSFDFLDYEFASIGPKGSVKKIVRFSKMDIEDSIFEIYNLAFGDYNKAENKIDDLVVTDNKDAMKVLASVAAAVMSFFDKYPGCLVFVKGNTPVRTRYYLMSISAHIQKIEAAVELWGNADDEWELFKPNKPYIALLARKK